VHLIGLVGMGCGVAQEVALSRPELVRSMVNMGCWSSVDDYLRDQLELFRTVHREVGFYAFQQFVCIYSFLPEFYNQNKHPEGVMMENTAHVVVGKAQKIEFCNILFSFLDKH